MRISNLMLSMSLAAGFAAPLASQQQMASAMPESYRQVQMNALELERKMLLAMVDSMPETLLRDKVTPIQRDFAQQIEHGAGSVVFIASRFLGATPPAKADTAAYLNTRAGLRGFVNGVYDWAGNVLKTQSEVDRAKIVEMFGDKIPGWEVWDEIHQHTVWTAGQVVANFRKNGMAPPGFGFF
jgi:hypothetical protein